MKRIAPLKSRSILPDLEDAGESTIESLLDLDSNERSARRNSWFVGILYLRIERLVS